MPLTNAELGLPDGSICCNDVDNWVFDHPSPSRKDLSAATHGWEIMAKDRWENQSSIGMQQMQQAAEHAVVAVSKLHRSVGLSQASYIHDNDHFRLSIQSLWPLPIPVLPN